MKGLKFTVQYTNSEIGDNAMTGERAKKRQNFKFIGAMVIEFHFLKKGEVQDAAADKHG